VAASTETLFFLEYPEAEPGDTIVAYRNDTAVGHIYCALTGGFEWRLTLGQASHAKTGISTLEEAKADFCEAFKGWCGEQGLVINGPCRVPGRYRPASEWILEDALKFKTATMVEGFMTRHDIKRHMAGMDRATRSRVGKAALAHMAKLQEQGAADTA
jgi:hypothetical protein